jgi:aryl-alcohol dehydrogenase-like predicted oxidoreductase
MRTRKLGTNGPQISVVGYGAWEAGGAQWGEDVAEQDIVAAIEAGIEAGMTWIDTAEAYGDGRSEEIVGRVVARHRDEVSVFTKVAPFASGTRPDEVKRAVRDSLQRLGLDHIDLYQVHWPDEETVPVEETWGAMAEIQDEGLVRHIGVSNFDRDLIERCLAIRHVDSVQNQFNLLHRQDADGLLPWLEEQGVGYLGYAPLAFGLLSGSITRNSTFHEDDWRGGGHGVGYYDELFAPGRLEASVERVDRLRTVADRVEIPLPSLAIAGALSDPRVTGVIAGSRKATHTVDNALAGDLQPDPTVLEMIEDALALATRGRELSASATSEPG